MEGKSPPVALADLVRSLAILVDQECEQKDEGQQSQIALLIDFPVYAVGGRLDTWEHEFAGIRPGPAHRVCNKCATLVDGLYELATCNLYTVWSSERAEGEYKQLAEVFERYSIDVPDCLTIMGWVADDLGPRPHPA